MDLVAEKIRVLFQKAGKRKKLSLENSSLYYRLYMVIKNAIVDNDLPSDHSLPATRRLATALQISRSTVVKAYDLLTLEGYISSKTGSGHSIRPANSFYESPLPKLDPERYPEPSLLGKSFQANIPLINSTHNNSIGFRPGLPPLDLFPVETWKNLTNAYWRYIKLSALTYSPASGLQKLKENIANYLLLSRNIHCDPSQVIIVSGSLQSLYILGSALINPGDRMVIEQPTFPNVISIFTGLNAQIDTVPVDHYGLLSRQLPAEASYQLIHTTPSCHYPFGFRLSLKRKKELLQWAGQKRAFIIENDYEHEVNNAVHFSPPIYTLDKEDRTIYLSTFNRLMHPSIRVGFMVVPHVLLDTVEAVLRHSHRFVPPSIQVVLNKFIEQGHLSKYVTKVIQAAAARHKIFVEAWQSHFGQDYPILTPKTTSLHLTIPFPDRLKDTKYVNLIEQENIVTHPLSKCYLGKPASQGLILGYSSVRPAVIPRKVATIARVLPY